MPHAENVLAQLRTCLTPATRVAVLSGAGISAASGVPTFRGGPDSLWENERPQDLATPEAFRRDPDKVWRWYDWRRGLVAACRPNPGHEALMRLEALTAGVTILTQNVDGLHQRAGSGRVIEYHGSLWTVRCTACGRETHDERVPLPMPPRCDACGGLLRPGVVWFGEPIDPHVRREAANAAAHCDLFLVVGTSGVVHPAAGLTGIAKQAGARVAEFNLEPGGLGGWVDDFVPGGAEATLPQLLPAR